MQQVPFWQDPAIRLALGTVVLPGLYRLLVALGVNLPFSQENFTVFFVDGLMVVGGGIWVVRRIRNGNDPQNPQPQITLTKPQS